MSLWNGQFNQEQRMKHIAVMLGYSPNHPQDWPVETINHIISQSELAAEEAMRDMVRHYGSSRAAR